MTNLDHYQKAQSKLTPKDAIAMDSYFIGWIASEVDEKTWLLAISRAMDFAERKAGDYER